MIILQIENLGKQQEVPNQKSSQRILATIKNR